MTTNPDSEPLPLEASPMGQVAEVLAPLLRAVRDAEWTLHDLVSWSRADVEALKDASTELLLAVQKVDTELRRRVG